MVKRFVQISVCFLILVAVMNTFHLSIPVTLQMNNVYTSTEFSVIGRGKVTATPDLAVLDAGITVNNVKSSDEAKNKLSLVNNAIIATLQKLGVAKHDIETSSFSIYPEYATELMPVKTVSLTTTDSMMISPEQSRITGYSGSASVQVKIRSTSQTSKIVSALTAAGATNISGPRFEMDKPEVYQEKARSAAIVDAKRQAEKLSKELGINLGKVTNMMDSSTPDQYAYGRGASALNAELKTSVSSPEPTFAEGTNTFSSVVTLVFERK